MHTWSCRVRVYHRIIGVANFQIGPKKTEIYHSLPIQLALLFQVTEPSFFLHILQVPLFKQPSPGTFFAHCQSAHEPPGSRGPAYSTCRFWAIKPTMCSLFHKKNAHSQMRLHKSRRVKTLSLKTHQTRMQASQGETNVLRTPNVA